MGRMLIVISFVIVPHISMIPIARSLWCVNVDYVSLVVSVIFAAYKLVQLVYDCFLYFC